MDEHENPSPQIGRYIIAFQDVQLFLSDPSTHFLSVALDVPLVAPAPVVARVAALPDPRGMSDDAFLVALAQAGLSEAEQTSWSKIAPSPRRRRQWLLGRLAAKDVARAIASDVGEPSLGPVDVVIGRAESGPPYAVICRPYTGPQITALSIAHTGALAVALGSADPTVRGVGIDIEICRPRLALERKGMTPRERAALAELPPSRRTEVVLRWWCAKEAAVKALGLGLDRVGGAQSIEVSALRTDHSVLQVDLVGSPACPAQTLLAATRRDGDLVIATVVDRHRDAAAAGTG